MIIGIDLGTTNSTLATFDGEEIRSVEIPQAGGSGDSLPSFLYFPLAEEIEKGTVGVEWDPKRSFCVGAHAKGRSGELPGRVITSAKSWLCHDGIDRRNHALPPEADAETMSPLDACAAYLQHLREAWDSHHKGKDVFNKQTILVTVPASFDPSARTLVQEAAKAAGYPEVILLEEPQAAFYAWLHDHPDWRTELNVGDKVLVVDVGGGTTDFSLIGVEESDGDLALNRIAVGQHLLLGGDNMDLALAHLTKRKLEADGHSIDRWQLQGLTHACRDAKEKLLSGEQAVDVTVLGRGSGLMAGSLTTQITAQEAQDLVVDGFAPLVDAKEQVAQQLSAGLSSVALPYAQDPRITAQLATFLAKVGMPTAVLFNGGTMKATALQERILAQLNQWSEMEVKLLQGGDLDRAVSRGAVAYGRAREGESIRIRIGASHSYYIGVEQAAPAVPGLEPELHALCVVPYGMEEGTEQLLESQEFALTVGEKATFRFFQSNTPSDEPIGSVLLDWKKELTELHKVEALLDKGSDDGKTVRVKLKAVFTELGVLNLWCVGSAGQEWKLEFDLRAQSQTPASLAS